jgi:hypothetical protein
VSPSTDGSLHRSWDFSLADEYSGTGLDRHGSNPQTGDLLPPCQEVIPVSVPTRWHQSTCTDQRRGSHRPNDVSTPIVHHGGLVSEAPGPLRR